LRRVRLTIVVVKKQ